MVVRSRRAESHEELSIRKTKDIDLEKYHITPNELENCRKVNRYLQEKINGYCSRWLYEDENVRVITLWVTFDADEKEVIELLKKYMPLNLFLKTK